MEVRPATNRPPLGPAAKWLIGLTAVASAFGYIVALVQLLDVIMNGIYGSRSQDPAFLAVSQWLAKGWYLSVFFGLITTPVSLVLAAAASFLSIGRRAKIVIWIIAAGGALGWLTCVFVLRGW